MYPDSGPFPDGITAESLFLDCSRTVSAQKHSFWTVPERYQRRNTVSGLFPSGFNMEARSPRPPEALHRVCHLGRANPYNKPAYNQLSYHFKPERNREDVRRFYTIVCFALLLTAVACSTKKNTAGTRRWHAFTARYNTYFNGKTSFDEQLETMLNSYHENYTERILMHPVSALPKEKQSAGGPFDRAILKGNKAIKQHSIQRKPVRKLGWQGNAREVAMQNREEYNPFLKHCWMLVAEGQFYNGDFLQAAATYSYIARHYATEPEVVAAAHIGRARCYAEMGWLYETESTLERLEKNGFPAANRKDYDRVYADFLVKSNRTEQAIPALKKVIDTERNRRQRTRMRYLLGQLLTEAGRNDEAYREFGRVASANPPYELEFAARIRQAEVLPPSRWQQVLSMLRRMSKSDKNKNYLDQVYMAIGDVYMSRHDTEQAIAAYAQGVEKSVQNGLDLAICQIKLGDIYFTQKDYVRAQPCFSGALSAMPREYRDYERVARLSSVLDELVVHVEAVHLQDSLQALARMPEKERLAVIDKIIAEVKEKEKREAEEADKERYLADQQSRGNDFQRQRQNIQTPQMPLLNGNNGGFYFYNEQTVAQGKTQFQNKWGKRVNQDDWRRRNKAMPLASSTDNADGNLPDTPRLDANGNPIASTDSTDALQDSISSDPKSREYYLQQIPLTAEDVEASNVIIADGLYNMGMIYKDKLENKPLSVETFEELERRFPDNKYRMDYYFQSYLMGLRYKDKPLETRSRDRLVKAFPESDYATAVADPNYEYHIRMMDRVQDSIYEQAYNRYLKGDTSFVRRSYREFSRTYPLATLMPKFMFVEALTYVQSGNVASFKSALQTLVEKYPTADVTELASEMLKGVLRGRALVQGSLTGMKWDLRFGTDEFGEISDLDSARAFVNEPESPHRMVLLYPKGAVEANALLYAVAAYNFAHFEVKSFDLSTDEAGRFGLLIVSGFDNLQQVLEYYGMIYARDGYARKVDRAVIFFPISDANYETLLHGKSPSDYMAFFAEVYGRQAPQLVARWRTQVAADEREAAREDQAVEQAADEVKERVQDSDEPAVDEPQPIDAAQPEDATPTEAPHATDSIAPTDTVSVTQDRPAASVKKKKTKEERAQERAEKAEKKKQEKAAKAAEAERKKQEKAAKKQAATSVRRRKNKAVQQADEPLPTDTTALPESLPSDTATTETPAIDTTATPEVDMDTVLVKPKEITLEYLKKRRELEERKARMAQGEKAQTLAERRQEAAEQRKQQLKEREAQRKQKEKEARERMKQREKERKEREKANKQRLKEKEAARRAALREKEAARREKAKSK